MFLPSSRFKPSEPVFNYRRLGLIKKCRRRLEQRLIFGGSHVCRGIAMLCRIIESLPCSVDSRVVFLGLDGGFVPMTDLFLTSADDSSILFVDFVARESHGRLFLLSDCCASPSVKFCLYYLL